MKLLTLLLVGMLGSGCSLRTARWTFSMAVVADAGTTYAGLRAGGTEANPVLSGDPLVTMAALTAVVVLCAELLAKKGYEAFARLLYVLGTFVHLCAAGWNGVQLWRLR